MADEKPLRRDDEYPLEAYFKAAPDATTSAQRQAAGEVCFAIELAIAVARETFGEASIPFTASDALVIARLIAEAEAKIEAR